MVVVPAGWFAMGSNDGYDDETPVHEVILRRPFAVGKYEVTFSEWDTCVSEGGCRYRPEDERWGRGDLPVNMMWDDAQGYILWLNGKTGRRYRLLTEAEWEYAARAGMTTKWSCGDDENCLNGVAWYNANSGERTQPVGGKAPNAFGLYDMQGNV